MLLFDFTQTPSRGSVALHSHPHATSKFNITSQIVLKHHVEAILPFRPPQSAHPEAVIYSQAAQVSVCRLSAGIFCSEILPSTQKEAIGRPSCTMNCAPRSLPAKSGRFLFPKIRHYHDLLLRLLHMGGSTPPLPSFRAVAAGGGRPPQGLRPAAAGGGLPPPDQLGPAAAAFHM